MDHQEQLEAVCRVIGCLLENVPRGRAAGLITEKTFVEIVLKIEAEQVASTGFSMTASNTLADWTVFKLRMEGKHNTCAAFEFLPSTGEFRRVGSGP